MKKILLFLMLAVLGMTQMAAQEYEYVPFVREGVKWVYFYDNTDNLINPDLAPERHYFTLELKGDTVINGKSYKPMHKYSVHSINIDIDTIPVYLREEDRIVYGIIPNGMKYTDCPIGNVFDFYNSFYNGQEFVLYDFADPISFWDANLNDLLINPAITYLSTDTIALGDKYAKRFIWQETNTKYFYQIEGIGSDSEKNGYTLYPLKDISAGMTNVFFHLSHVVENGKIIYKGFHYDPSNMTGINEILVEKTQQLDTNYYNLMGQSVGTEMPTTPGIYIHQGKKIIVR